MNSQAEDVRLENTDMPDLGEETGNAPAFTQEAGSGMSALQAILHSARLGQTIEGKWHCARLNATFTYRSLTNDENDLLNQEYTVRKRVGKTSQVHSELNMQRYMPAVIELAVTDPNFRDNSVRTQIASALKKPNDADAYRVIRNLLLPGEISELAQKIMESSGFGDDEEVIKALKD